MMRIVKIFSIVLIIIILISNAVYASDTPFDVIEGKVNGEGIEGIDQAKKVRNRALFIVQLVGSIIAISLLIYIGIKYMIAAPEGKAQVKQQMTVFVIGATLMFGAVGIVEIIKNFETAL